MAETDELERTDEDEDEDLDDEAAAAAAAVAALALLIGDDVEAALAEEDEERRDALLAALAVTAFTLAYQAAGGTGSSVEAARSYARGLRPAIGLLQPDGSDAQAQRMTDLIAHSATTAATVAAAVDDATPGDPGDPGQPPADLRFEWRTQRDDRVRDMHRPVDGQMRAAGEAFDVGGHPQRYPGHPIGPPEAWINCRCFLIPRGSPVTAGGDMDEPDALVAVSEEPWSNFSASDYSIEQWRRACILTMPGGDPESKGTYKLPIRTPSGALNRAGVHAAAAALAGARGGVSAPAEAKAAAKAKLRGAYKQIGDEVPDSLKAASGSPADLEYGLLEAADERPDLDVSTQLVAVNTHDAPGWITHPKETQRLRTYWTKGAGAAKIRWGTPGDLTRCHRHLGKYVGPQWAWGTCQNLHHAALGKFNPESRGRRGGGDPDEIIDMIDAAFGSAAATLEDDMEAPTMLAPPLEWFGDPGFDAPTPLTITSDGRVLGHLASWDTCHVGITGECIKPPRSNTGYAHFRTGEIETAEGELVAVGQITMDTGHADRGDSPTATVAHYDNTGTGVADVAAGEDNHGIWVAGAMRPGVSEQQMYVLKATGALSGDWRRIGGNLELVAALAVNVPGFPIPRVEMAASAAGPVYSLVAAAVVSTDPNALNADRVAVAVLARLDQREADKARRARATALTADINAMRAEALTAGIR